MAEEKKISTEETENHIKDEKKMDSLDALLLDDDSDFSDDTVEEDFDTFMAEYRDLLGKKRAEAARAAEIQAEIEYEKPEEVLISVPEKHTTKRKSQPENKVQEKNPDWDEKITLAPEEYDDPCDEEGELIDSTTEQAEPDFDLGEITDETDSHFQISINFEGDKSTLPQKEDEDEKIRKYNPEKPRAMDWVFDIAEMFVFVLVAVMLLTAFVFRHSIVEGQSMMNTLDDGDHLIISNLLYTPERGDIIVFEDYSTSLKKAVVKRIIGLPGETVEVRMNEDGEVIVYINGEILPEKYAFNARDCYLDKSSFNKPITIGENEVFVMGDNRYHSTDSRDSSVGPINIDSILGKVVIRFLPFDKFGTVE